MERQKRINFNVGKSYHDKVERLSELMPEGQKSIKALCTAAVDFYEEKVLSKKTKKA